jgi:general secretion pathway protein A
MHNRFYGFSEEPFVLEPELKFIFLTDHHIEVVDSLVEGIKQKKGFMLLTGDKGVGKTSLMHHFLSLMGENIKAIPIFGSHSTIENLLESVLHSVGFPPGEGDKGFMIGLLEDYFIQRSMLGETPVLIIDEAQNLNREILEELRLLATPDPRRPKFLQEIFVADSGFEEMLNSNGLTQLTQRFAVRRILKPLTEDESGQYLEHRLSKAGGSLSEIFTPEAVTLLSRYARGIPRTINMLGYLALSAGYALSQKKIDTALLERIFPLIGEQTSVPLRVAGSAGATGPPAMGRAWGKFVDFLAGSPRIMRISYALLVYSLVIWLILLYRWMAG